METQKEVAGLRKLRRDAGLTQTELAEKTGLSQQAVSDYEVGNRKPSLDAAEKLALGLDRPMEDIARAVKEQRLNESS